MKLKAIVCLGLMLGLCSAVRAERLGWFVGFSGTEESKNQFTSLQLFERDGSGTATVLKTVDQPNGIFGGVNDTLTTISSSANDTYTYYVVITYADSSTWSGLNDPTTTFTYADLKAKNFIYADYNQLEIPPARFVNMVPEPTTGMLALIGLSMVMLRRKKREQDVV